MEYWFTYLDEALIYSMLAVSLNILLGFSGISSVGSAAFAAIGGYSTALLTLHAGWDPIGALCLSIAVGAAAGIVVSAPILALADEYVMLLTMSLSILVITITSGTNELGGQQGIVGLPFPTIAGRELFKPSDFVPFLIGIAIIVALICWRIGESPFGRVLRATRDDELGVKSLGKSTFATKMFVFSAMCALTALAGSLLVLFNGIASPSLFSLNETLLIFAMVIVGGLSSIPGSVVGAFLIIAVSPILETTLNVSADDSARIRPIVFGVVLILIVRFRPQGIVKEHHKVPRTVSEKATTLAQLGVSERVQVPFDATESQSAVERPPVVLQVSSLSKRFGGVVAVDGLTLQLRQGEITALVGANGAGKSTVFNLITGAIRPDAGEVLLDGEDITRQSPQAVARKGMVRSFQDLRIFPELTPLENVMLAGRNRPGENPVALFLAPRSVSKRDRQLASEGLAWLEFVGIEPTLKVNAGSLAFAQQKQVAFARVLATKANIFLLDEPLSGIEGSAVDEMLSLIEKIRESGRTICVVEHSIQAISRLADWAYFMETGKVTAEGTIHELLADQRLTEAYFGSAN
ncbi:MAG: branched-chain amino acid transport system ATP-binding protein livM [Microbacteriaceae bacterium]|nr:branched-chain amino acid transport system ATP-binding protein livM [Microbacteriaceae bacterium]